MRHYLILGPIIVIVLTMPAAAQTLLASQPPAVTDVIGALAPDNSSIAFVLTTNEQLPLGPRDILQAYEQDMAVTALATCESLAQIASAYRQGDINDEQAEYASRQTYAIGLMQFQMLSTLHDILDSKIEKEEEPEKDAQPSSERASKVPGATRAAPRETVR